MVDGLVGGWWIRLLTVIEEYSRGCLAIRMQYKMKIGDVMNVLRDLLLGEGHPYHIRSDNSSACLEGLALCCWCGDLVHCAWQSVGEWV